MRSVNLNDPVARQWAINKLSTQRNRNQVAAAVMAYANSHKDRIIDSNKEREELAVMITRQANRQRESIPMARAFGGARKSLKKRKYNFKESSGKGVRKFDGTWRGYRIADAKTEFDAKRLAKFLRRKTPEQSNKVRVVKYQADGREHYSVYSQQILTLANKGYIDGLKKFKNDPNSKRILNRVHEKGKLSNRSGVPILVTKKRLPEIGLKMRVY